MKQSSVFYLTSVENILINWVIMIGALYATVKMHRNVLNFIIYHVIITAMKYCSFKKRKESKVFNTGFKTMLSLTCAKLQHGWPPKVWLGTAGRLLHIPWPTQPTPDGRHLHNTVRSVFCLGTGCQLACPLVAKSYR